MLEKEIILIVDDTPDNLSLISEVLKDDYIVKVANKGEKALKIVNGDPKPDLILLDIEMPEMDGYEVCRKLKENPNTSDLPVIFITAKSRSEDEQKGLDLGAVDYITKPISLPIMKARIKNQLHLKAAADFLKSKNDYLEKEVKRRTVEVRTIQDVTVLAMATLAEARDRDTGNHIIRTQMYIKALAQKLKSNYKFSRILSDGYIDMLYKLSPLHDIGKVGIQDSILLKPGPLTVDEFKEMKTHTTIGMKAIENAERRLGYSVEFLKYAKEIALYHHEKWDGTGYPMGISSDEIPVSARLMAIADVYDALTSKRVYKEKMSHEQAVEIITKGSGNHFDPDMVNAFLEIQEQFRNISAFYQDKPLA